MDNNINSGLYIILFILTIIVGIGLYYKHLDIKKEEEEKKKMKEGLSLGKSISRMFKVILTFPKRIANIGKGLGNIFKGIGLSYWGILKGTSLGFKDIVLLVYYASYFIFTYTICTVQYIKNIPKCIFYYIVDIFFQLIYLPVRLVLFCVWLIFRDVYKIESRIWKLIYKLDIMIYDLKYELDHTTMEILKNKVEDFKKMDYYFYSAEIYKNHKNESILIVFTTDTMYLMDLSRREIKIALNYKYIKNVNLEAADRIRIFFNKDINNVILI